MVKSLMLVVAGVLLAVAVMGIYQAHNVKTNCADYPEVSEHFKSVIGTGRMSSEWLDMLPERCRPVIYEAGFKLNAALDYYSIPFMEFEDTH